MIWAWSSRVYFYWFSKEIFKMVYFSFLGKTIRVITNLRREIKERNKIRMILICGICDGVEGRNRN